MKPILPLLAVLGWFAAGPALAEVSFVHDIAPVLVQRCAGCHGDRSNMGGFRARNFEDLSRPGASGKKPIIAGKPADSLLFQLITAKSEATRMPMSDDPLSPAQVDLFRKWIFAGAPFDGSDRTAPLKSLLGPRINPPAPAVYRTPVPVMAVALVPGGKSVAVSGYHEVTLWNTSTGLLERRIGRLPQRIQAIQFSRDGRQLIVAGGSPGEYGEADLVDMTTGKISKVLDTFNDIALATAFSADEKQIVVGGADASVRVYDRLSGKATWVTKVHSDWVTSVCFSSDGKFVASASRDMTVKVYEAATGALFTTYNGHNRQIGQYRTQDPVYAVRFAPDSSLAYSAGGGQWIQAWDPVKIKAESGDAGDMEERFAKESSAHYLAHGFKQPVFALVVCDGKAFAASADGTVKEFNLVTPGQVRTFTGLNDWVYALDYDSHRIAAGAYNGKVCVWDADTGQCLTTFLNQPRVGAVARFGRAARPTGSHALGTTPGPAASFRLTKPPDLAAQRPDHAPGKDR